VRSRAEPVPPHAGVRRQETQKWWENFLGNSLLKENETAAFKKLVRCSKITFPKQLVIFLYKVRYKWQHHTELGGEEGIL
jgi:hypothetical protein